jgi:crotonobetainyl-CoA:carnitine CoA-transferase CaiB-like acyl-CoA transferase
MKEKFWALLCQELERPDLTDDPRFATFDVRLARRDELIPLLAGEFRTRTTQEWLDRLTGEVPCAPVNSVEQALAEPQVQARGMIVETENETFGRMRHVGTAIKVVGQEREHHEPAPDLGEDTDEILREELGYPPERIARLREAGAI